MGQAKPLIRMTTEDNMGFGLSLIGLAVVLILVVLGVVKAIEIIGNKNKRIK
ncbi:hypothetical protein [Aliidiomarina shirensis]|uniref:hypothetical protein n=1 Tax=Aliidiomarina shirensis TaxID=1048642 RepID=UPI0013007B1F|nr:hypothetical protein [Aliidiomarina shirensis]